MTKFYNYTLPHGGKLLYVKNKISKISIIDINFDCGARIDTIPGISHFVEHMFFSGTDELSKDEINKKYFAFQGANASTCYTSINFYAKPFTDKLSDYVSFVAEIITKSTFTPEAVEKEKPIVKQEIVMQKDKFGEISSRLNYHNLVCTEVSINGTLGREKTVSTITSEDVKNYVKKWFVSENLRVTVTSPLSFSKVKKMVINALEKKLPSNKEFKPLALYAPNVKDDSFYVVKKQDNKKVYVYVNFTFDRSWKDYVWCSKVDVLMDMLNDVADGVNKSLRTNKSLVYSSGFSIGCKDDNSYLKFYTNCEEANVNEVIKTLSEYVSTTLKNGLNADLFDKVKKNLDYSKAAREPRATRRYNKLYDFVNFGKLLNGKKLNKLVRETTLEECNEMFKEIFASPRVSATIYGVSDPKNIMKKSEFQKLFKF